MLSGRAVCLSYVSAVGPAISLATAFGVHSARRPRLRVAAVCVPPDPTRSRYPCLDGGSRRRHDTGSDDLRDARPCRPEAHRIWVNPSDICCGNHRGGPSTPTKKDTPSRQHSHRACSVEIVSTKPLTTTYSTRSFNSPSTPNSGACRLTARMDHTPNIVRSL